MNSQARTKLRSRSICTGVWLSCGSPVVAELAALSGLDWVLFDMEHGCTTDGALLSSLQAVRGTSTAFVVRVPSAERDPICRALDWGADGIMVPHVATPDQARQCVRWMRHAPHGNRGFARSTRGTDYGLRTPHPSDAPPVFMPQIETPDSVAHAAGIAEVDGVDVLFVGPADLRHSIESAPPGTLPKPFDTFDACLHHVASLNKPTGILLRDESELKPMTRLGFRVLAIGSDLSFLKAGFASIARLSQSPSAP